MPSLSKVAENIHAVVASAILEIVSHDQLSAIPKSSCEHTLLSMQTALQYECSAAQ